MTILDSILKSRDITLLTKVCLVKAMVFPVVIVAQLVKKSACNAGDLGSNLGLGRSPGEGKGYPLQYFILENSMDCTVHGVAKSQTRLSNFHFTSLFHLA